MKTEYRIVEVTTFTLSKNNEGIIDYIPEILEKVTYSIECRFITKVFFVFTSASSWQLNTAGCSSIAQAEAFVNYLKKKLLKKKL